MAKQAPDPIDVQDFQFILQCRLKIFTNEDNTTFDKLCNLVATASRFGLVFIGSASPEFQVVQLDVIEKHEVRDGEITNYPRRVVPLPSKPKHLSINCDCTKLAVVVEQNNCPIALIYDVTSMLKQEVRVSTEIRLSPTPGVNVIETSWNPTIPNIFTVCKDDGTLGLYEMKETGLEINELPIDSQASCMCWSPKGKQIAVGSRNGKITQYKPDLKAMKVINAPPLEGSPSVIALQWISNYQFVALYKSLNIESGASLLVIDAPKTGDTVYTNYDDICYSYGNTRPSQFYTVFQPNWNVLMVASSNSMEVGVLGTENNCWLVWILPDSARAELPLSASKPKQETLPVGMAFDIGAAQPVVWGETSLPPAPYLLLLSHHGLLCCFRALNVKAGVNSICQPREALADTSGLSQFTTGKSVTFTKAPEPEKQINAIEQPTKLVSPQFSVSQTTLASTPPKSLNLFPSIGGQFTFSTPKSVNESVSAPKPEPPKPLFSFSQNTVSASTSQETTITVPTMMPPNSAVTATIPAANAAVAAVITQQPNETSVQEDSDILISKLIREECEILETELKALLHKGRTLKINLGTDSEAVSLVHGANALEEFLQEVNETSSGQAAEVHSLKQALIQTWAWYEDARSRFAQTQDVALETLLRIQKLDPVSQRYLADIRHMCYYLNSQITQAQRTLDEQWENFQDSCKNIVKMKIPTMEAIYQTMVRQNAIQQRQQYVLKDISRRIRTQRSKITGPSLLLSLNNADQLEKELERLQLEPQHILQAQYERVLQSQKQLTTNKIQKLSKLILDKEVIRVTHTKPKLPSTMQIPVKANVNVQNSLPQSSFLVASLSPITTGKQPQPKVVDFIQSTPKTLSEATPKQTSDVFKPLLTSLPKFSTGISTSTPLFSKTPSTVTITTASSLSQFNFTAVTTVPAFSSNVPSASSVTVVNQVKANVDSVGTVTKPNIIPISFNTVDTNNANTNTNTVKPISFTSSLPSTKPSSLFTFSLTTTSSSTAIPTKPLTSTANSAFVPTTVPTFNFSIKNPTNASVPSSLANNATSKAPTFVFGKTASVFESQSSAAATTTPTIATSPSSPTSLFATLKSTTLVTATTTSRPSVSTVTSSTLSFKPPVVSNTVPSSIPSTTSVFQTILSSKTNITNTSMMPQTASSITVTTAKTSAVSTPSIQGTSFSDAQIQGPTFNLSIKGNNQQSIQPAPIVPAVTTSGTVTVKSEKETSTIKEAISGGSIFSSGGLIISGVSATSASSTFATTTSSSLFGISTTNSGSLFVTPAATTSGSLFTSSATTTAIPLTTTTSGSLFGISTTSSGSLFATSTTSTGSIFGTTTTSGSLLGTPTKTTSSESVFSIPTATTSGPLFGTFTTTSGPLFSTSTTTSGSLFSTSTAVSKSTSSTPTTATTSVFNVTTASVQGSLFSAPPATTTTSTSIFASGNQTQQGSFSSVNTSTTTAFNTVSVTTATPTVFASVISTSTSTTPSTTSASGFPAVSTSSSFSFVSMPTSTSNVFKMPVSTSSVFIPATTTSIFGSPTTTSIFGSSGFGTTTTTSSIFGSPTPFGSSAFTSNAGNVFGGSSSFGNTTTTSASVFSQPAAFGSESVFGAPTSTTGNIFGSGFSSNNSLFAASNTTQSNFGQSQSSTFSFANAAANVPNSNSAYGFSKPSTFGFGAASPNAETNAFSFGNLNMGSSTASPGFGSAFGQSSSSNPFAKAAPQQPKPVFGGGSLFSTPTTTSSSSSIFGGGSNSSFGNSSFGSNSGFGSSTFGQQPAFGQTPPFGNSFGSPSQPGPFSGGSQSVSQTGFGGFGQTQKPTGFGAAPVFGGSPTGFGAPPAFGSGSPSFGTAPAFGSPTKVFGSPSSPTGTFGTPQQENSTFANLATQNTLGFGSLAQQSQPNSSMSSFGGGSSFSTWR